LQQRFDPKNLHSVISCSRPYFHKGTVEIESNAHERVQWDKTEILHLKSKGFETALGPR